MRRRDLFILLGAAAVADPARAQRRERPWRIGLLGDAPPSEWGALREGLRELGYVEGDSLLLESLPPRETIQSCQSLPSGSCAAAAT